MNLTLHLTDRCNLRCRYCFAAHGQRRMTDAISKAAVDMSFHSGLPDKGFAFFGGEPLLERDMIYETIHYAVHLEVSGDCRFHYKLTTNGLLLDDDFLRFANEYGMEIALSHDGLMHAAMRLPPDGNGEVGFAYATSKIPQLLAWQPNAMVMMTVCVSTVSKLAESVEWLYDQGFRRINVTPDSRPDAGWSEETLELLAEQYRRIACFYVTCFKTGEPFIFPLFEEKIRMRLSGRCAACHLGYKQPSVSPDGHLYPCVQFLGQPDYVIGDVFNGLDENARRRIHKRSEEPIKSCEGCAIADRCRHHCACLNFQKTGDISLVSPAQCLHERLLIPIADEAASKLFAMQSSIFLRRFYGPDNALIQ